jgi:hypothetical protein
VIKIRTETGALRAGSNLLILLITVGLLAFFTIVYVHHEVAKICGLIVVMDQAYAETPPTTEAGRHIADEVSRYRDRIGC